MFPGQSFGRGQRDACEQRFLFQHLDLQKEREREGERERERKKKKEKKA